VELVQTRWIEFDESLAWRRRAVVRRKEYQSWKWGLAKDICGMLSLVLRANRGLVSWRDVVVQGMSKMKRRVRKLVVEKVQGVLHQLLTRIWLAY